MSHMLRLLSSVIFILALSTVITLAQDEEVPAKPSEVPKVVIQKIQTLYPNQKDVNWSKVRSEFNAEFKINGHSTSVLFDNGGNWIETESEISAANLPKAVSVFLAKSYPGFKPDYIVKTSSSKIPFYEITLKKGNEEKEVNINEQGQLLNVEK